MWSPWRYLRDHLPHVLVRTGVDLPGRMVGAWTTQGIFLDRSLDQCGRRVTLTHELAHYERGPAPMVPWWDVREEAIVDQIVARRLITLEALADALAWCGGIPGAECAEELWVDQHTLTVRMRTLSMEERAWLAEQGKT